ncbi:MAG: DUF2007 domain-containing protein [Nitrospirae bacterium]|nr:DUF2007 domain-containing protein [Nitrospirota bacterium]
MIKLLIPDTEVQLALVKGILETEEIPYYVLNDHFGSMWAGAQIELYNQKAVMVDDADAERARGVLGAFESYPQEPEESQDSPATSLWDKIRMVLEVLLFGWIMPRKR